MSIHTKTHHPQPTTTIHRSRNLETQLISTVRNPQECIDLHRLKPTRTHRSPPPETHNPPRQSTTILSPRPTKQTHQNQISNPQPLAHNDLASVIVPTKLSFTAAPTPFIDGLGFDFCGRTQHPFFI